MTILGIDEAGRGALAGPVVVAGCIFKNMPKEVVNKIKDSKKLTIKAREYLYEEIIKHSIFQIEEIPALEIDILGVSWAIRTCIEKIYSSLHDQADETIFDGNWDPMKKPDFKVIVKADDKIKEVSAASILAKVYRDRLMILNAQEYPEYGFQNHKGYGTKAHIQAINKFGHSPLHRKTYHIRKL